MEYQDHLKLRDMEENKRYPVTQGQGNSDGIWIMKSGENYFFRHFWILEDVYIKKMGLTEAIYFIEEDDYLKYDKEDHLFYPKSEYEDNLDIVNEKIMRFSKNAFLLAFEEMSLYQFHEKVYLPLVQAIFEEGIKLPIGFEDVLERFNKEEYEWKKDSKITVNKNVSK